MEECWELNDVVRDEPDFVLPILHGIMDDVLPALFDDEDDAEPPVSAALLRKAKRLFARSSIQHPIPPGERRPAGSTPPQHRGREFVPPNGGPIDYPTLVGLHQDQFEWLFEVMQERLEEPRDTATGPKSRYIKRTWTPRTRLLLALHWLKTYPSLKGLSQQFGGHPSTISREIKDTIPKLCEVLYDVIAWPDGEESDFGAIDCCAHYRNRVHPFSSEFYRGDHHRHFLTAQLICSLHGQLWDLQIGLGMSHPYSAHSRCTRSQQRSWHGDHDARGGAARAAQLGGVGRRWLHSLRSGLCHQRPAP